MKSVLFWSSFVIGFIVMLIVYWQNQEARNTLETFEPTGTITPFYEGPYIPDNIKNLVYMYLSSFSDVTADNTTLSYESVGGAYWRDLKEGKELFNVIGTNLPTSLRSSVPYGLPMSGVRMIGPPSENFAYPNTGYVLPSMSICFYGRWKSVQLEAPLLLFRMYAETPNAVSITYSPIENDADNLKLSIVLGATTNTYDWVVPKTTLLTQSAGTLYSYIYDKEANTLTCFVGSTNLGTQSLSEKPIIKLSNSPIEIAYTQNWDFHLQTVLLCRGVVTPTDITATSDYFVNLSNGKTQEVAKLQQESVQVKQTLETCSSKLPRLLAEIENLKGEVMYNETEMKDLRKKLEREKLACIKAASGESKFQWLIKNGKCPDVRKVPEGVQEFPHMIPKPSTGLTNAPSATTAEAAVTIAPPTTTSTFQHAIAPIGSAQHQSWVSKWIPWIK